MGIKLPEDEIVRYLELNPYVFSLEQDFYQTKAGAFTDAFFSFKPEREEVAQKYFIVGDRCMPFVDGTAISSSLNFVYKNDYLPTKTIEIKSCEAVKYFSFFGEEYVSQYIAADPANRQLNLAQTDFELPQKVKLTVFSFAPFFDDLDFKYGDRILCKVLNWDSGKIAVEPVRAHKKDCLKIERSDVQRSDWYRNLETCLLEDFSSIGPCTSIEEQLSNVFYENRNRLCRRNCGSLHEFLNFTRKISFEAFGVETRLWFSGQDVPAVGSWNDSEVKNYGMLSDKIDFMTPDSFSFPDYILDAFAKDQLYAQNENVKAVLDDFIQDPDLLSDKGRIDLLLRLAHRNVIILKEYNWFADFRLGFIRHSVLQLFFEISKSMYRIDSLGIDLRVFPQQDIVILSQLFNHVTSILDAVENDPASIMEDSEAVMLSIGGMNDNFEDIEGEISAVVKKERENGFIVIG